MPVTSEPIIGSTVVTGTSRTPVTSGGATGELYAASVANGLPNICQGYRKKLFDQHYEEKKKDSSQLDMALMSEAELTAYIEKTRKAVGELPEPELVEDGLQQKTVGSGSDEAEAEEHRDEEESLHPLLPVGGSEEVLAEPQQDSPDDRGQQNWEE